jgi:DNA-binding response OmpR family regulator
MSKRKTILFAEDDRVLLTAYRKPLEKAGYHIITAHDGLMTMQNLFVWVPDLLILDLMLPKLSGEKLCGEKLLQFIWSPPPGLSKVPFIILTSKSCIGLEYVYLMKFAAKYLTKQDCTPALLLEVVQEHFSDQFQEIPACVKELVSTVESS